MQTQTNDSYDQYKPSYAPLPRPRVGDKLIAGAAVAGLLTAGAMAINGTRTDAGAIERAALTKVDKESDMDRYHGFVIAKPGTILRSSPLLEEQTIVRQLDDDESLLMPNPVLVNVDGENWLSFQFGNTEKGDDDKIEQAEEKTVWVDITTLSHEKNSKGEPFLEWYPYDAKRSQDVNVSIDESGTFRDDAGNQTAVASIMSLAQARSIAGLAVPSR